MKSKIVIVKYVVLIIWPILCTLILIPDRSWMWRALFVELVIYGYLTIDILPLAVTSIIIVFLGPMLHVQSTNNITTVYFATAGLALSTMFNALTLQYSGLHERLTLWLIIKLGCTPRKITCALLTVSHILSMWLSNTFTFSIMIPVVMKIYESTGDKYQSERTAKSIQLATSWVNLGIDSVRKKAPTDLATVYIYAVVFGAVSGGLCFARGSPTNITYLIIYTDRIKCYLKTDIWFLFTLPVSIVISIVNCLWLQIAFLGLFNILKPKEDIKEYENILKFHQPIEALYEQIGPITCHEICVGLVMLLCIILWVLREPYGTSGWQALLTNYHIQDSAVTFFISFLMVIIPSDPNLFYSFSANRTKRPKRSSHGLVTWLVYQKNINWGDFFFIGCINFLGILQNQVGLGKYFAKYFAFVKGWPLPVVIIVASFIVTCLTEFVFNAVMSSMLSPTLIELAIQLNFHPMSVSFICCLCYSFAFIFTRGARSLKLLGFITNIKRVHVLKAALVPKTLDYVILVSMYLTYGKYVFYYNELQPDWIYVEDNCYCWPCGKNESRFTGEILLNRNTSIIPDAR